MPRRTNSAGLPTLIGIFSGAVSSNPSFIASAETSLFFAADNRASGIELWVLSHPESAPAPTEMPAVGAGRLAGGSDSTGALFGWSIRPLTEKPRTHEAIAFQYGTRPNVDIDSAQRQWYHSIGTSSPNPRSAPVITAHSHRHADSVRRGAAPRAMWLSRIESPTSDGLLNALDRVLGEETL